MNRQRSTFITLMNTMAKSTELATIALESNGTMLEVQGKYMETVEGKMGKLKATSQTFWSTLINSNAVKAGIDALTGVMETLTKVSEIFGGTATAILGIGAVIAPTLPKIASLVAGLSEAGTVMGGLSALLSSMISPVGIVIAGFSLLAVGVAAVSAAYKDTNERIAEATESLDTFERKQKGIEANQSLLNTYVTLNKKLESGNLTLEERESIQQQINEVSGQLGGISSEVNGVLQDGNKTLEEKRGIIQDIINLMSRENAEELDKKLDSQAKMNDRYKDLIKNLERAKSLKEELEKGNVKSEYISQYTEDLKYANEQVKNGYKEIEKYNESVKEMGPHAEEFGRSVIKMSDDLESYHKELVSGTEATKGFIEGTDNITASLTPIPNHISRTAEEIKALDDLISGIDELMPTVDLSDINLEYVSDEFIDLSSSIATAQAALAGFIDTYNALGGNLDLMEDMKTNLEQNGYFTDDMIDKILASGNADLIALLDDEGATWENLISLIDEYKAKQEEAKQQAIDRANEEAKLQDVLKEKHEEEKRRIEEIMELTSKAAETSIKDGNFVDPTDSIKQISQVIEMSNGLKSVIAEINGQKVMINYDENGYFQTMSNVKEITDGTYASMMDFNGTKVVITIDENGKTATYALEKVTELANGTKRALAEIDGKKYVIDFDANDNIADMQEVIDNAQEFSGIMEGLDGKTYRVTFDKETLQQDIQEVTKNIDGTYSLLDESGDHPIEIIMNGDGEVIGKIDGVNTKIDEFEERKEVLNGTSLKVTVEGTEQTVTDLKNIVENADGTYTAIGELNGKHVLITFDNKGQTIDYLNDITANTDGTYYAITELNGKHVLITFDNKGQAVNDLNVITENTDGTRSAIVELNGKHVLITFDNKGQAVGDFQELTANTDGTYSAIVELNGKHVLITFDNKGQTVNDLKDITKNTDGTYTAIVELNGKHIKITFDNKGRVISDLSEVTSGANSASTARDGLNKTPFSPKVNGADRAAKDLYNVAYAAEYARGQAGEIRITTVHENITRNITQTATVVSKGGAASGALPYSIDIPGEQIFEPVEATQDVVIMANPIADTSEVEAFDMGSEVEAFDMGSEAGGDGGDGLSAPIADVQPMALSGISADTLSNYQIESNGNKGNLENELNLYYKLNDVLKDYNNLLNKQGEILDLLNDYYEDYSSIGTLWGESLGDSLNIELENAIMKSLKLLKDGANEFKTITSNSINATPFASSTSDISTSTSQPTKVSTTKDVVMGGRVKVTDPNASIYVNPNTSSPSGTWKGIGVSSSDTMYVYNMNNGKVALSRTQGGIPIGWIDIKKVQAFATGGYTGDFSGGQLGLLHPKERVLSAEQTKNFEILVSMLGDLVKNPILQLGNIMKDFKNPIMETNNNIEINNNFNITNNTAFDLDRQNENLTQLMSRELRRFGKITTK